MIKYLVLAAIAIMYGYIEQNIYRHGNRDNGPHIWKINPRYHLPLVGIWLGTCYLAGAWWAIGIFCVIEDLSYFAFHPDDTLDEKDWVTFSMGGIRLGKFFIPTTYFIGIGLSVGLYFLSR